MNHYYTRTFRPMTLAADPLFQTQKKLTGILFLFSFGIFSGFFLEFFLTSTDEAAIVLPINELLKNGSISMLPSLITNILFLLLIYLSGLSVYLFPASFLLLFLKSCSIGFCFRLLLNTMGENFSKILFTTLLPSNLLLIPVWILAVLFTVNYGILHFQSGTRDQSIRKTYSIFFMFLAALILVSAILECICFRLYT